MAASELATFAENDCLRVAIKLRLPVHLVPGLPVPVEVRAVNPLSAAGSGFREFRIQTVRVNLEDQDCVAFTAADDPFDADYGPIYFGLYAVGADGLPEHIANRPTCAGAVALAQNLVPGLHFQPV